MPHAFSEPHGGPVTRYLEPDEQEGTNTIGVLALIRLGSYPKPIRRDWRTRPTVRRPKEGYLENSPVLRQLAPLSGFTIKEL